MVSSLSMLYFVNTLTSIIRSGDVEQARAYAAAHPACTARMTAHDHKLVRAACLKWSLPSIVGA